MESLEDSIQYPLVERRAFNDSTYLLWNGCVLSAI